MAHWNSHPSPASRAHDKPLPAPPPSPASSVTHSSSSRAMRSRSSSTCISRLPSFTSTLSSDQSQPQEIPPPLPVSVIVHGEFQHELVLRPLVDGYLHERNDSFPDSLKDHGAQYLCPSQDDKDSVQPSPTLSSFSCAYSRETSITTPFPSSPASPTSAVFSSEPCSPANIALPASPVDDDPFTRDPIAHERAPSSPTSRTTLPPPKANVFLVSPTSELHAFPLTAAADNAPQHLRAPTLAVHSQSRWSVATTASVAPSTAGKSSELLNPRTSPKEKQHKGLKTPKKRTRFISLISRFSPGRADPSSTTASSQTADDIEYDSANESDTEDREKNKPKKSLSKKSSLASLRASFSLSRASFSSQRPIGSSSIEDIPPLPTSPTLTSLAESAVPLEVVSPSLKTSISRIPSRANLFNASLPPLPQSASTITTFQSASQLSISDTSVSDSRVSLACPANTPNGSRISLLPPPSKRTSLASAAGVEPMDSTKRVPANQAVARSKSIFRLTAKPKSLKTPITPGVKEMAMLSRLPITGNTSLPSPTTVRSRIPHAPNKFNPPAKLVSVIASQSRQAPALASPTPISPTSKLPMPPSRALPKAPRPSAVLEKPPVQSISSLPSSKLPMPASAKGARVGTVRGFWKRS
ncbi:hypothetical protein HD554DRAFT_696574 [Boletus coccyginus]|nr:hypothetical protein HD554DRAFT_696574 [Boletus coccyginus]